MNSEADELFYGGAAGGGKGLRLETILPTPDGFTTMEEVSVGDRLFGPDGKICNVIGVSDISYRKTFRLTFDDGSWLEADDVHRWVTFDALDLHALTRLDPEWRKRRQANRPSRAGTKKSDKFREAIARRNAERAYSYKPAPTGTIRNTLEIKETLLTPNGKRRNHAVQVAQPLDLPDVGLPIDPYVFGLWLGDGFSLTGAIGMSEPDAVMIFPLVPYGLVSRRVIEGAKYNRPFVVARFDTIYTKLRKMGLLGNKGIPGTYLRASFEQRLALVQGMMDTDGNCTERGACEFTTTLPSIRDGFRELLASLGIKAEGSEGRATLNGKDCGPKYRFKFMSPWPMFRLPRKAERQNLEARRTTQFRYICSVEEIGTHLTKCISVDSPTRMYLAGRSMIPTHNTDLLIGTALTRHRRSIIFRREFKQLMAIRDRTREIYSPYGRYNGQDYAWRLKYDSVDKIVYLGGVQNTGDEAKFQGHNHDLKCFDEVTSFTLQQYEFLIGWNRTAAPGQRSRVIAAGNPPTNAAGYWVIQRWAPWVDKRHPNPAKPGELRWFARLPDQHGRMIDTEVDGPAPIHLQGKDPIIPRSRTFIRALLKDNPYYEASGYRAVLQAMPEPLRSQMLEGDFGAGQEDDANQVIPTAWVLAAQARWSPMPPCPIDTIGADIARGGNAQTVFSPRHGWWFGEQTTIPGASTPDGWTALQHILNVIPSGSDPAIHIDIIGVGASVYDLATGPGQGLRAVAMDARHMSGARDRSGKLGFSNKRAEWWWKFREALDPLLGEDLALPPDQELLADLTAPRWEVTARGILIEGKDDIYDRIGRSTDKGDSMVMAFAHPTPIRSGLIL